MCPLSAILSHLLSRWSISQAGWCLLWWIWKIWWFPQRHAGSGVSNRGAAISRPVARTAHIWKDRDFIYDGEMTAGVDGARNDAATTPLRHLRPEEISKVSEINGLALYFQNREIKQTLMNFRLVLIWKYCIFILSFILGDVVIVWPKTRVSETGESG